MTQDIKNMVSTCTTSKKSANNFLELDASGEGSSISNPDDISILREQLMVAKNNIAFLQNDHASTLKGLHGEIERLQDLCRDLQFRCEAGGCLLPDNEFFKCSTKTLETKVNNLLMENSDLKRKLLESHQAIDILDQKEKLALWQHHQELEQRDEAILSLEKELEAKNSTITQLTANQGARRKKSNFWKRLGFNTSHHPSTSTAVPHSKLHPPRVEHLSKEDLPTEMQSSFPANESQYQSYSSYSSLSDNVSDDEGLGHHSHTDRKKEYSEKLGSSKLSIKLPPISGLQGLNKSHLVRQQSRVQGDKLTSDSLAIDQMKPTDIPIKRTNKT